MNEEKPKNRRGFNKNADNREKKDQEFEQRVVDVARVTRVTAGGKRMRFRACVVIGNKKGKVGFGVAKGADVSIAINKAVAVAQKMIINVSMAGNTIPHEVKEKYGAARILIKPAPLGTGVKAGGSVRIVLELAGVEDAVSKILGANNKINNIKAAINALKRLKISKEKRKSVKEKLTEENRKEENKSE